MNYDPRDWPDQFDTLTDDDDLCAECGQPIDPDHELTVAWTIGADALYAHPGCLADRAHERARDEPTET